MYSITNPFFDHFPCCVQKSAEKMCELLKNINSTLPINSLSFVIEASKLLVNCYKVSDYVY